MLPVLPVGKLCVSAVSVMCLFLSLSMKKQLGSDEFVGLKALVENPSIALLKNLQNFQTTRYLTECILTNSIKKILPI